MSAKKQSGTCSALFFILGGKERKLTKKQKLVTDSGIEILVPLDILKDDSIFEYHQNDDGKISILIKEIGSIENK